MAYVKNYNPGKITMDLPWTSYYYELPLLSFSDLYGGLNLSLVFNQKMKVDDCNPYHMAEGYKLNIHKRVLFEGGVPCAVEEANGSLAYLAGENGVYMFQDESQRVLRISGTTYVLENPDSSYEVYDSTGRITDVFDKYESNVLKYTYNAVSQKLQYVSHGIYMTVEFSYSNDQLSKIKYAGKEITLGYDSTTENTYIVTVNHYTGEAFELSYSHSSSDAVTDVDSISAFCATENSTSVSYVTKVERNENIFVLTDQIGSNTVSATTYNIHHNLDSTLSQVEITNNEGVKTRVQYEWKYPLYAYEINSDAEFFSDADTLKNRFRGNVQLFTMRGLPNNHDSAGVQTPTDGMSFNDFDGNGALSMTVSSNGSASGYYIVSGWIRSNGNSVSNANIGVGVSTSAQTHYTVDLTPYGQWKFFSCMVYAPANKIEVSTGDEKINTADGNLYAKDWRVSFMRTGEDGDDEPAFTNMSEYVLIRTKEDGTEEEIHFHDAKFLAKLQNASEYNDISGLSNFTNISAADILKWKICKKISGNCTELYYNNCANVLLNIEGFKVEYDEQSYDIDTLNVAVKTYAQKKVYLKKINIYEEDSTASIVIQNYVNDNLGSEQTYNNQFDLLTSSENGVTTTYTRNKRGLLTAESIGSLCSRTTKYGTDDDSNTTITVTDEHGEDTVYTLDYIWGTVKSVTLPDGTVVTDEYDDDMCTMTKRIFGNAAGRSNSLTYSAGNLSRLQTGDLYYSFGYSKGDLTGIQKNGTQIETHVHTDTAVRSYYPHGGAPLHSTVTNFDKYGRLTSVYGVLTNVYDSAPTFDSSTGALIATADNGSALLAMTTDELRGETARYKYNQKGLLEEKTVTDAADFADKISEEVFVYDTANRLSDHTVAYTGAGFGVISGTITYKKDATDPTVDNTVSSYTHKVGDKQKAYTENTTDDYHRLTKKNITVDTTKFTKRYYYSIGRVTRLMDAMGTTMVGDYSYTYDEMGRIRSVDYTCASSADDYKRYTYDQYGQLIREDNLGLAKTYVYAYNDIGNITSVKVYNYSLDTTPSGTPVTTTFSYTNDQLTSFGGETIAYDSIGCPAAYEGMTATWTRGKLSRLFSGSAAAGSSSYVYNYNAFGQRVSKTYSYTQGTSGLNPMQTGQVINCGRNYYYDHAGRLIAETIGKTLYDAGSTSEQIVYLYDESSIVGMEYTTGGVSTLYYFQRNLQGDVVAIFDASGNMVAKYLYDAWGNCTISSETTNYAVANANPIRYRGYYYDDDTGLYYLNSRYYSPKWRRFISPDDTAYLNAENVNGLNLYCYCYNDPVNHYDPSGHFVLTISALLTGIAIGAAIGAGFAFGATLWTDWRDDGQVFNGSVGFDQYFGNTLGGAISGAGIGVCGILGVSLGISIVASEALVVGATTLSGLATLGISMGAAFGTGALGYSARVAFNTTEDFEWADMFIAAGANAASGLTTFITSMWRGALGYMIPGQKTSLHNLILHQIFMIEKGGYFAKGIIAILKKYLQEEY